MKHLFLLHFLLFFAILGYSQTPCSQEGFDNPIYPLVISDIDGNCYTPDELNLPPFSSTAPSSFAGKYLMLQQGIYRAGIFILYFDDILLDSIGDNFNFYPSNTNTNAQTLGQARIELTCRVYDDLSVLLHPNPWTLPDSNCVRIKVLPSGNLATMGQALGKGGPIWIIDPNPDFVHGMVAKTIQTGIDGYTGLGAHLQGDAHGTLQINFGHIYNLYADTSCAFNSIKLYTLILHEATHQLGFLSSIRFNGQSGLGYSDVYSMYDKFLTKNGNSFLDVVSSGGAITAINIPPNMMDSIACDTVYPIRFDGVENTNQIVHSPPTFVQGSSLSHFQCEQAVYPPTYIMQAGLSTGPLGFRLNYDQSEVYTLCDLGYTLTGNYGTDTITNDSFADTRMTYVTCGGCTVSGVTDNAFQNGVLFEICRSGGPLPCPTATASLNSITIPFSGLLSNDVAQVIPTAIDTFRIIDGGGSFVIIGNSIIYTPDPNFGGTAKLWYMPSSDSCFTYGAYIFINVHAPVNQCQPNTPASCNYVCNGDFENFSSIIQQNPTYQSNLFKIGYGIGIFGPVPTTDLYSDTTDYFHGASRICYTQSPLSTFIYGNGSTYIGIVAINYLSCPFALEPIHLPLRTTLPPGTYEFRMKCATNCAYSNNVHIVFTENAPTTNPAYVNDLRTPIYNDAHVSSIFPSCSLNHYAQLNNAIQAKTAIIVPIAVTNGNSITNWPTYTQTFTITPAMGPINHIVIHTSYPTTTTSKNYHLFDDIEIVKISSDEYTVTALNSITACAGDTITIAYSVAANTNNADTITVNLAAIAPLFSNFSFIDGGGFMGGNASVDIAPNTSQIVNLTVVVPSNISLGTYPITLNPSSDSACISSSTPPSTVVNLNIIGSQTSLFNIVVNTTGGLVLPGNTVGYQVSITNNTGHNVSHINLSSFGSSGLNFTLPSPIPFIANGATYTFNITATGNGVCGNVNFCVALLSGNVSGCIFNINNVNDCAPVVRLNSAALNTTINSTNVSCNGQNNGTASISVLGTVPYSYLWSNGQTMSNISGLYSNTYSVTATDAAGCTGTNTVTISQPTALVANATQLTIPCTGTSTGTAIVSASGGTSPYSYLWSNGQTNATATALSGGITYIVTVSDSNNCSITASILINSNQLPTVIANANPTTICLGDSLILTGSGAQNYAWNNGVTNGIAFAPTSTTTYSVTGTDSNGCQNTNSIIVTVSSNVTASASSTIICSGNSVTLTGSGANNYNYTWSHGLPNGATLTPLITTTYTVTGTDTNGCESTDSITILVNPSPIITINANSTAVCLGNSVTLTANGANTYTWNNGVTNGISFVPITTTTYTVTGTDTNGCESTDSITILVNPSPIITINANSTAVCLGNSVTLTANGANTYTWNNGITNGTPFIPIATTTYIVTGTDTNGCQDTTFITIIVNPLPSVTANASTTAVCSGNSVILTGNGANIYTWNNGVTNGMPFIPIATTTYTVTGTNTNGCQSVDSITIIVNSSPNITISATADTICFRDSVTLTASGANTYTWSSNNITNGLPFAPLTTATYTVTGTNANGCQNTASITVVVTPRFTVTQTVTNTSSNSVTITQTVCAVGSGTGTYTLTRSIPSGWSSASPTTVTSNLTVGAPCHIYTIVLSLLPNPNLCNLGVQNCVSLASGTCATVQNCLIINTNSILGVTIIPPTVTTFSQAINGTPQLLLNAASSQTNTQIVVFQGNIVYDIPNYTFINSDIRIAPNVQITLKDKVLTLNNTFVHGCNQLWRSITLNPASELKIENGSRIQDGLYAIEIPPTRVTPPSVIVKGSTFRNNYAAIYTPPATSPNMASLILTQVLFEGGALLPTLGPSVAGTWAYAGILLHDFAVLSMNGSGNTFQNLANGIVAYRSNIDIYRAAIFKNILPRGYIDDGNAIFAKNDLLAQYSLSVTGLGQTGTATFDNCRNGIMSTASHLTVTANNMTNMQGICIESRMAKSRKINITQNRIDLYSNWSGIGINLLLNDASASTLVSNNILDVGRTLIGAGLLNIAGGGIIVDEQNAPHSVNITQNTIRLYRASVGISLTSNRGARVLVNSVDFRQPFIFQIPAVITPRRVGIALNGCDGIALRCNNTLSNWPNSNAANILPNTTGIRISDTRVTADCNSMARTHTGMQINGTCVNSIIRGNSFTRHNIGLHYTEFAQTAPPQIDAGNRWLGTWGNRIGAQHDGNSFFIANSIYIVATAPQLVPPNNNTPNWFFPIGNPNPNATYSCINNPCLPSVAPLALNSTDVAIVNNQIAQNPTAIPWELRRGLYNKLDKNPNFQLNPIMGQFYNTYQNQTIGTVVETAAARENTMLIDTTDMIILELNRVNHEMIIDSLENLDSLYLVGNLNNTNWTLQRQIWLQQWLQNYNNASSLCNNLFGICQTQSLQAQAINATISHTNIPEENEKLVNEIYLQTIALGSDNFDTIQIQTLYNIAHQCPELGGTAVYRARSIYSLIAFDTYNDICNDLSQAKSANIISVDTCYSEVHFLNPSLEGSPWPIVFPLSWNICESTPDVQPFFSFAIPPSDGTSYIGLGAAAAFFKESFGQEINDTLLANTKYRFAFDFATAATVPTGEISIWISDSLCEKNQLIYSATTTDTLWHPHIVEFIPNDNYNYIIISAEPDSYIFIDNLRSIPQPFGCDTISSITPTLPDRTDNTGNDVYTNITTTVSIEFKVYPNPNTQGQLMVEWTENMPTERIEIIDALGRVVGSFSVDNYISIKELDIKNLPSGTYVVLLKNGEDILGRKKLVVIKQ